MSSGILDMFTLVTHTFLSLAVFMVANNSTGAIVDTESICIRPMLMS